MTTENYATTSPKLSASNAPPTPSAATRPDSPTKNSLENADHQPTNDRVKDTAHDAQPPETLASGHGHHSDSR